MTHHTWRFSSLPVAVLASLLLLSTSVSHGYADDRWRSKKYILPILKSGPNNQLRHLRFMLALGKQLNRTVILTGMTKHYTDRGYRYRLPKARPSKLVSYTTTVDIPPAGPPCFKEKVPYQIEFNEMLDRQYVEEFTDVTTADEMRAQGWDSVIDALVYPNESAAPLEKVIPYVSIATQAAQVHMYHDLAVVTTHNVLRCRHDLIQALARQIDRWRVVALVFIVIGNAEVANLVSEGLDEPPAELEGGCWQDLFHANRRLKANAWLQGIGRQYVQKHVGSGPYLAVHVRPQADPCWRLWMNRNFDPVALGRKGVCWAGHETLHLVVGPKSVAAMRRHNLTKLVVLTHPNLQPVVTDLLAKVNLTAQYINPAYVAEIAGCVDQSSTFLMLVEMQVAVQSTVFLGTASSSITETVLYERLANGITANEFLDRPFPKRRFPGL